MRLWLLRHAPVQAEAGLCYGRSDWPAEPRATRAIARRIAAQLPPGLALRTSPLCRCAGLAAALHALLGGDPPRHDARIAEMDFGAWEGRPWRDIPRPEFDAWIQDFASAPAGGSGESVRRFMARVALAWDEWRAGGKDALWVTHAGVIRAAGLVHAGMRSIDSAARWPAEPVAFGGLVLLETAG